MAVLVCFHKAKRKVTVFVTEKKGKNELWHDSVE